jgi:predicted DCC family thiol-disulfide oxidoreductase YuxK
VGRPAPLLIAYDAECPRCRHWVDWVQRRDRWGLVIPFPLQNPELIRMAPELAGLPLDQAIHGLDTNTREVKSGARLLTAVGVRLPRWRWLAHIPGLAGLVTPFYRAIAARRQTGRVRQR